MAKSRVSPLKPLTILRLELFPTVIAAKLATVIHAELCLELNDVVYWSDSTSYCG